MVFRNIHEETAFVTSHISDSCYTLFSGIFSSRKPTLLSITVTRSTYRVFRYDSAVIRRVSKILIDVVQLSGTWR